MKEVRSLIRWMLIVMILLSPLATSRLFAQQNTQEVNGKVSFKIESKTMTLQEATAARNNKTAIPLKVSLIFEGQWVTLFDNSFRAYANSSFFSFGIAQKTGLNSTDAPLYTTNPPAYIYSSSSLGCSADGVSLEAPYTPGVYIEEPGWEQQVCPLFAYGAEFSNSSNLNGAYIRKTTYNGNDCYELDLFYLNFRLKDLQTVYVRGIDCNTAAEQQYRPNTDNQTDLGGSTVGTTILNLINPQSRQALYWPNSPSKQAADWTLAPDNYYGGVIPGGIFIEQAPEVAQLTPVFFS